MAEYIERKALENAMAIAGANGKKEDRHVWARAICLLHAVQTADVDHVVHGKWAHIGGDEWCCTDCGFVITTEGSWENPTDKYCSNCGAKMDLED